SAVDNQIIAHEWGHLISNRLISDAGGLINPMGFALGEGWADFQALLMTVREEDALAPAGLDYSGTYSVGAYALSNDFSPGRDYYFGIRRVPYSTDFSKNALTYRHVQSFVSLPAGPPTAFGSDGADNSEAHNAGEVWCTMLWECYAALLRDHGRLTFAEA